MLDVLGYRVDQLMLRSGLIMY